MYVICSCWKLTDAFLMSLAASAVAPNLRSISFCFVHFCSASITDRGFEAIVKCCKGLERVCSWRIACSTWHLARHNIQACRVLYVVRAASKRLQHLGVARASIPLITAMACILYSFCRRALISPMGTCQNLAPAGRGVAFSAEYRSLTASCSSNCSRGTGRIGGVHGSQLSVHR